jgi:PAS domain S-box-containing protein
MEGSELGLWEWEIQTNNVYYSPEWKSMLGYEDNEISNDLSEWKVRIHPDDLPEAMNDLQKHLENKTSMYSNVHRMLQKNGEYKYILDRGKVVSWTEDSKPAIMVCTHTDLNSIKELETEYFRKASELESWKNNSTIGSFEVDFSPVTEMFRDAREKGFHSLSSYHELYPENYFQTAAQIKVTDVNTYTLQLFNASKLEEFAEKFKTYEEFRPVFKAHLESLFKGELSFNHEVEVQFAEGSKTFIVYANVPFAYKESFSKILATLVDITPQKAAQKQLIKYSKELRDLALHLQDIKNEERNNLAREIHDQLGQDLTTLGMELKWLVKKYQAEKDLVSEIQHLQETVDKINRSVKQIGWEVRLDNFKNISFSDKMKLHCEDLRNNFAIECKIDVDSSLDQMISKEKRSDLLKIFREIKSNIIAHSKASEISISLIQDGKFLRLSVSDNGVGFNKLEITQRRHLGLIGMRERAASMNGIFSIESSIGHGTRVEVVFPF